MTQPFAVDILIFIYDIFSKDLAHLGVGWFADFKNCSGYLVAVNNSQFKKILHKFGDRGFSTGNSPCESNDLSLACVMVYEENDGQTNDDSHQFWQKEEKVPNKEHVH